MSINPTVETRGRRFRPTRGSFPGGSARHVVSHAHLLWRITRNEISARYAGSFLGAAWVFIAPMLILGVYGLVYLSIFRFQPEGLTSEEYVLYIFSGLVPYLVTAEALAMSIGSVSANKSILTNTVFPIDLVPVKAVLMSMATMIVGLLIIIVGAIATGNLHWTIVLLPVVVLLQIMALIGMAWIVSLLNVVFRDLQNLIAAVLMILLIASPIAYTPAMVPANLRPFLGSTRSRTTCSRTRRCLFWVASPARSCSGHWL